MPYYNYGIYILINIMENSLQIMGKIWINYKKKTIGK